MSILVNFEYTIFADDGVTILRDGETMKRMSFRALVTAMEKHPDPAPFVPRGNTDEWYFNEGHGEDGTYHVCAIRYAGSNPKHRAKYWRKAAIAAGIVSV
jgi:hypothetical protein